VSPKKRSGEKLQELATKNQDQKKVLSKSIGKTPDTEGRELPKKKMTKKKTGKTV